MNTFEYIWLDGYEPEPFLRSKVKATEDDTPPDWSFDGSSTLQAEGGSSDCLLLPVQTYQNTDGHDLVMTEVLNSDGSPHESNARATIDDDDNDRKRPDDYLPAFIAITSPWPPSILAYLPADLICPLNRYQAKMIV